MKIEKINKLKSGKYKLTLDDNEKIITYDDVILKNNLLYGKKIDDEVIKIINEDTEYFDVYNKLIKYIYTRKRSSKEIKTFLTKFDLNEKKQNEILNRLKEIGLLNDISFVKSYISDRIHLSNFGPFKIINELKEHDIDECLIEEEISKIDSSVLLDKISKLVLKKINSNNKYSNYILKQKLLLEFYNLGYSKEMVEDIIDYNLKDSVDILNKTYDMLYDKLKRKYSDYELLKKIKEKLYQKGFDINEINDLISKKNNT